MSNYLLKREIVTCAPELKEEFEGLLRHRWFAARAGARQWEFFRHCFGVLVGETRGDFPCDKLRAAQYKFEVSDRLRRYYLLPGAKLRFIFTLAHEKQGGGFAHPEADYPTSNEYLLLVTRNEPSAGDREETRALLERVVADAVDAEWGVYARLPELNLGPLEGIFHPEGGASRRIRNLAIAHHRKGLTISNENNPSTRRLVEVKVEKLSRDAAQVRTVEYWYLRWWSPGKNAYVNIYNETNRQRYFLSRRGGRWEVTDNVYPPPRTSTPRRWRQG